MDTNGMVQLLDASAHFFFGWISGCAGVLVSHPLDTVKVRLQTQGVVPGMTKVYKSTWHCLLDTVKHESVFGLFKGMSSPLLGTALWNAVIFGTYGSTIRFLAGDNITEQHRMSNVFIGSITSGIAQTFIITPLELTKTRLQIQSGKGTLLYSGLIDCCRKIYKQEGFLGLFRGYQGTFIRDLIGFSAYFVIFEQISRWMSNEDPPYRDITMTGHILAGGITGACSWFFAFPTDALKCRMQVDYEGKYSGLYDCFWKSYREEGRALFTRGLWPCVLRGFPMNAAIFSIYHYCWRLYQEHEVAEHIVKTIY